MAKKERLKELSELIKTKYNLDVVTTAHTKSQQQKWGFEHNPAVVIFKMRYRLTGGDMVQLCPISWLVIDAKEDALIIKTCGEMLSRNRDVKIGLSVMAQNAEMRAQRNAHEAKEIEFENSNNGGVSEQIIEAANEPTKKGR